MAKPASVATIRNELEALKVDLAHLDPNFDTLRLNWNGSQWVVEISFKGDRTSIIAVNDVFDDAIHGAMHVMNDKVSPF